MTETASATTAPAFRGKVPAARLWRYLIACSVPLLLAGLFLGVLYLFLVRAGETTGPIAAAQRQAETGEKYGAALVYRPFAFKLERYRAIKPDVLIVGSSRVMAFAGEAFKASVYNSGGAANTLDQAIAFVRAARAIHKPKAILLGLDFWWFNPNRGDEIDITAQDSDAIDLTLSQLLTPLDWMAEKKVSATEFLAAVSPFQSPLPGIGALAQFQGQGWDKYGRYDYGDLFDGRMESDDVRFERTLERLRKAKPSSKFSVRVTPEASAIADLRGLLDELRADGIEVTLLLPPIAPSVLAELTAAPDQILIPEWLVSLNALGVPVVDVQDAMRIGSDQCEFIDGFHGGEVTYLRILYLIGSSGAPALSAAIDREAVEQLIRANAGHARITGLRPAEAAPEVDFLELGCVKPANPT